jgi:CotH kinase protein
VVWVEVLAVLVAAAVVTLLGSTPAAALTAAEIYEPDAVVVIDLALPPASVAALETEPGEYAEGTLSLAPTDGTPGGIGPFSAPLTVGVRLKGEGSFQNLDGKAAFKLKFSEFVKGQKFLGLKGMTLNNMLQDPSMVHETLAYRAFRAAGVPAPRTGYADVRVNGEEFGLHLNVETLDDVALERLFGSFEAPPQHLYEASHELDLVPGDVGAFEVDEGEEDDRSDLEALVEAVAAPAPPAFSQRVAGLADLEEMTRMWAVERYIDHWDSYSGRADPNNYYLHSDPLGAFQMLPWGTDQSWSRPQHGFGPPGPVLFEACFADPACAGLYRGALYEAEAVVTGLDPGAEAIRLATLLAPWQSLEVAPRKPFGTVEIAAAVAAVGAFAASRPAALAKWLGEQPPAGEGAAPGGEGVEPPAAAAAARTATLSPKLPVDRASLGRGLLATTVHLPGPGTVRLTAEIATVTGAVPACAATGTASEPGPLLLSCRLSASVRRRLAARWLRLQALVSAEFADTPASFRRTIRLPRTAPLGHVPILRSVLDVWQGTPFLAKAR